ncbi:MAG: AAC(3) family N-acetyltransferase [Pseudomonadota bacterium]
MTASFHTQQSLLHDLRALGVQPGDGLFVHSSMRAIGRTVGGARSVVEALITAVGEDGLVGMPGFSDDAYPPPWIDPKVHSPEDIRQIEAAVPGFDIETSPTAQMGVIAETFRTWPGTQRSSHPNVSVCLYGKAAGAFLEPHGMAWATGQHTPLGRLRTFPAMKMLLIGVGWNRCSALHTAEDLAPHKRTKVRRFKDGGRDGTWREEPDVADDLNRLFPSVGAAFENTGAVSLGTFGDASTKLCDYATLLDFASAWIDRANQESGDQH